MSKKISVDLDFENTARILAIPDAVLGKQPVTLDQLTSYVTGLLDLKGSTDCSTNPNYPVALKGDAYIVSVAGKIGGASGVVVQVGDVYFAIADNAGGTQAGVGSSWNVIQANLVQATESTIGYSQVATQTEVNTGSDDSKYVTPLKLKNWTNSAYFPTTYTGTSTNSTYVTVATIPVPTSKSVSVFALCSGVNTGNFAQCVGGRFQGTASNSAGTVTVAGSTALLDNSIVGTPGVRILASGTDVLLQVRSLSGAGTVNINWTLVVNTVIAS